VLSAFIYHPEERLIGEVNVTIDGRQNAEYETDEHHHEPENTHSISTKYHARVTFIA